MRASTQFSFLFALLVSVQTIVAQDNPIMFCTQTPHPADFSMLMGTFANHVPNLKQSPRGGDLYIRYPNGVLKNLTQLAGYGESGMQGDNAIAVRDPCVHWNGTKAIFSMVVGATEQRYVYEDYYWQLYEVTGLGEGETPVISLVPNQPNNYNNVSPIYGTDDRVIFVSDCPRGQQAHLYPQHDEYESTPVVTGLWRIDPNCSCANSLEMLTHSPSGDFTPIVDSNGRIVFVRWDHLKRDQQADADILANDMSDTFNYADESADAIKSLILPEIEVFPEPLPTRTDLLALPQWANTNPHDMNVFTPWMINEDGTELETLNHIGRHDSGFYFLPNFTNDPNLVEFLGGQTNYLNNFFHVVESPTTSGLYYGTDAQEFRTHAAGGIVTVYLPDGVEPSNAVVNYVTHPDTRTSALNPSPSHTGLYRNPIPLANGGVLVLHTANTEEDENLGDRNNPISKFDFRLQLLEPDGEYQKADGNYLTGTGITKTVSYWDPDELVTYSGLMWESFPVEVKSRPLPANSTLNGTPLSPIELALFEKAGVSVSEFQEFLARKKLAMVVTRNVTSRAATDRQQPFNLRVVDGGTETISTEHPGNVYDVEYLQFLQGDQLRGRGGIDSPRPGRRVIPQYMHDDEAMRYNLPTTGDQGSVNIQADGSIAAIVPANRAMTWQLTADDNHPIVRERIWMSFVPGEVRVCSSCHGGNNPNQAGENEPTNSPTALTSLLNYIKTIDSDKDELPDLFDTFDGEDFIVVTHGSLVSGTLLELATSDDTDFSVRRSNTDVQSRTEFVVTTGSHIDAPTTMSIELEGSVFARTSVIQTIELYNYATKNWESIDSNVASRFIDRSDMIEVTGDVSRFIDDSTMAVQARVRFQSLEARQKFSSNIDRFKIEIGD